MGAGKAPVPQACFFSILHIYHHLLKMRHTYLENIVETTVRSLYYYSIFATIKDFLAMQQYFVSYFDTDFDIIIINTIP